MTAYGFYNVQVARNPDQVRSEIRALVSLDLKVLGLCETTGYELAAIPGQDLIRDRSTKSRANIAAYVDSSRRYKAVWHDMAETWGRTEHPGEHEPRSWLEIQFEREQVIIGHQPPKGTDNVLKSQEEGVDFLISRMAPWSHEDWDNRGKKSKLRAKSKKRIVLADFNRRSDEEGPGPSKVASQVWGHVFGSTIDCAVARNMDDAKTKYVQRVHGVNLMSDHDEALIITRGN